jgi:hypothetical protein
MSPLAASGRRSGAAVSISVGWLHGTWLLTTVFAAHPQDRARDFNAWQLLSSWRHRRPSDQPARKGLSTSLNRPILLSTLELAANQIPSGLTDFNRLAQTAPRPGLMTSPSITQNYHGEISPQLMANKQ